ncbi:MAG: hypothetical protein QF578_05060 [Alphaproteobacteria bacterium]|jgi:hypothetical protein|nr:hypothetical protein [Alphaproteobacteria bacterium]MDP6564175.1 hypothetical protein [Alphaproteobacteria bacterium]MDP6812625.1 hypothetical protein [Alphaproteobacteria bacterium]
MTTKRGEQRRKIERRLNDRRQREDGPPNGMERRMSSRRSSERRGEADRRHD